MTVWSQPEVQAESEHADSHGIVPVSSADLPPENLAYAVEDGNCWWLDTDSISNPLMPRLSELRVLVVAGVPLTSQSFMTVLMQGTLLQKLDASHCKLCSASWPHLWASLKQLSLLHLHSNALAAWDDVLGVVAAPSLEWLTLFENPIASQPEYRGTVLSRAHRLLALDSWVVTDDDRIRFVLQMPGAPDHAALKCRVHRIIAQCRLVSNPTSRFVQGCQKSVIPFCSKPSKVHKTCIMLLCDAENELEAVRRKSHQCSAASAIQSAWDGYRGRQESKLWLSRQARAAKYLQKVYRDKKWKQEMIKYTRDYLKEIDELDLMLSTADRLKEHARKLIERMLRSWVRRRMERRQARNAGILASRCARGFLARTRVVRDRLQLATCQHVFFPEEFAWEFLVLLNVVRCQLRMEPLPRGHEFEACDMLAVRMPESSDMPKRHSTLTALLSIRNASIIRRCASGRFPQHQWDGPFHRLREGRAALPRMHRAYSCIRRRAASVDNNCRQAFLQSCTPSSHPIHRVSIREADSLARRSKLQGDAETPSHFLTGFLEGGPTRWQRDVDCIATDHASILASRLMERFLRQAVIVGARPIGSTHARGEGEYTEPEDIYAVPTAAKAYGNSVWLNQRLLSYNCESESMAHILICTLIQFRGSSGDAPLIRRIPFLPERMLIEACAATSIQSLWRAHQTRCSLACSLRGAAASRRAVLCIQRSWRWSLLRRRLELLGSMRHVHQSVKTNVLYIEERLLLALNFINSIDRYAPLLSERRLCFGHGQDSVMVLRNDHQSAGTVDLGNKSVKWKRDGHLPAWLWDSMIELSATSMTDPSLRAVGGLHGLILEDVNYDMSENNLVTVAHDVIDAASTNSILRFVELRFPSLAAARRRAVVLHACTWSARHRLAVPILPKSMLFTVPVRDHIFRLWEAYDLTWQPGDRVAINQLRQRSQRHAGKCVPACGREPWRSAVRSEWLAAESWTVVQQVRRVSSCQPPQTPGKITSRNSGIMLPPVPRRSGVAHTKPSVPPHSIPRTSKRSRSVKSEQKTSDIVKEKEAAAVPMMPVPPSTPRLREGPRVRAGLSELLYAPRPSKNGGLCTTSSKRKSHTGK